MIFTDKKYKIGINLVKSFNLELSAHLRLIKSAGFDCFFTDSTDAESSCRIAEEAARAGLEIASFHAPFGDVHRLWKDTLEGQAVLEHLISCAENAAIAGVGVMVVHPFIGFHDHEPTAIGEKRFYTLCEKAFKHGVRLAFENVEGEEYLEALMKLCPREAAGFCWDSGHEACYNGGRDRLALYGDRLIATHINDNRGVSSPEGVIDPVDDLHLIPFDGILDWQTLMVRLEKTGYKGALTLELKPGSRMHDPLHQKYITLGHEEFYSAAAKAALKLASM